MMHLGFFGLYLLLTLTLHLLGCTRANAPSQCTFDQSNIFYHIVMVITSPATASSNRGSENRGSIFSNTIFRSIGLNSRRSKDKKQHSHVNSAAQLSNNASTIANGFAPNKVYIIFNRVARQIMDRETISALNFDPSNITVVDEQKLRLQFIIGEPVQKELKFFKRDADDVVRFHILKSTVLNGNIVSNIYPLGTYINPSVIRFRSRLLLVCSLQMGYTGSQRRGPNNNVEFRWVNHSNYPYYSDESYLGVKNEIAALNREVHGQDPRVIVYNDSYFQIFFTSILLGYQHQKMGVADVRYLEDVNTINITYYMQPIAPNAPLDTKGNQKNWSPFIYNGEPYLIQSINPLIVVSLYGEDDMPLGYSNELHARVISWSKANIPYCFFQLRGGTNAIRLGDRYLAFYHSRAKIPGNMLMSYVFGAYSFTTQPPFEMLTISPTPIMPETLFTGRWAGRFMDYCVYPMHISLKDERTIHISFGYQDQVGMIAEIDLHGLIISMVPVNSSISDLLST